MLLNIIRRSFLNQKRAMAVMIVSVAVGTAIAASLLSLSFDISSKVSRELRSFGANIVIEPKIAGLAALSGQKRYLREDDLVKAKTIFWRHNILGAAPFLAVDDPALGVTVLGTWYAKVLPVPGEEKGFRTGGAEVMPWWQIEGRWPQGRQELLAGVSLARRLGLALGSELSVMGTRMSIVGIVSTGGKEDNMLV
ncbi:MAG: ABC transporter permease, partial [Thermodesulfovibrionales bacterium]